MIKLVACDLDGTLLKDDKTINDSSIESIRKVIDKGVIFAIASGRPLKSANKYRELIDRKMPLITYNGGEVLDEFDNVLFSNTLDENKAKEVINFLNANKASIAYYSNRTLYVNKIDENNIKYGKENLYTPIIDNNDYSKVNKILWVCFDSVENEKHYQLALKTFKDIGVFRTQPYLVEFVCPSVTKASGIKTLCVHYHINYDETMAIGDEVNDIEMISFAAVGVAMNSGAKLVKDKANYVTSKTNNEDGVSEALNKFILNK